MSSLDRKPAPSPNGSLRVFLFLLLIIAFLSGASRAAETPNENGAAGHWEGEITLPPGGLQVKIDLSQTAGSWAGTIDIPAQNAKDLPLEGISVQSGKVHFKIQKIQGDPTFDGTLALSGAEAIEGTFTQGGSTFPFRLGREKVAPPVRRQVPQPPFPYSSEEVTYTNGTVKLAGTLTIPLGDGPFPAVVMITGSGAQDRDETVLGHKPFLVLADHLSRHGIAVLRADDRGIGGSTGSVRTSTTADFAEDALAGVHLLETHARIAKDRIGLIGHSEGGVAAPIAASRSKDVAFIVLLSGTGLPGPEVLLLQIERISRADGASEESIRKEQLATRRTIDAVLEESDPAAREAKLRRINQDYAAGMTPEELRKEGGIAAVVDGNVRMFGSPWAKYFLSFDPRTALRKVTVPVLALNGEKDLQVIADQNLPEIEKALKEAGNKDVTIVRLPGINHVLQPDAVTGSPMEYQKSEITVAPVVLETVTRWIDARFGTGAAAPR